MTEHRSVRKIVEAGIGVNHTTVWRWRHRFLKAAAQDNVLVQTTTPAEEGRPGAHQAAPEGAARAGPG